ncbi:hypothetical protein CKO09_00480 [Chromatium weissei]|nr:hypothetical protein [Chromatium weissei]
MPQFFSQLIAIQTNLFPKPLDDAFDVDTTFDDDDVSPMPTFLAEAIATRIAAAAQHVNLTPRPGLIVRMDAQKPGNAQPLAVLLTEPVASKCWRGYLCAHEIDYASTADLVLDVCDAPCDPLVAMVQCWNPAQCDPSKAQAALGELAPQRLAAVQDLATEYRTGTSFDIAPKIGSLVQRETSSGQLVLTGTPLGGDGDLRFQYQALYRDAAAARLHTAPAATVTPAASWMEQIWNGLRTAAEQWQLPLEPVLQPTLGEAPAPLATLWRLGNWLNLQITPAPTGDALQLHAVWQMVTPVVLELTAADGQVRQRHQLDAHRTTANMFVGAEERLTLRIYAVSEQLLFEAPFPDVLPTIHH